MDQKIIEQAIECAKETMDKNIGGPFGAAVIKDGEVISVASNTVLSDHDPTAHAEVNAIREAGRILGTHDLSGCEIYATGYPCPMCMSAIIWANIGKVYYSNSLTEAEEIGFRDDKIYEWLKTHDAGILDITHIESDEAKELYEEYRELGKEIY